VDKVKAEINTSLAEAWGIDEDGGRPSDDWPYKLDYWGVAGGWTLYRFSDGQVVRYAGYDPEVGVISGAIADLTIGDLADEFRGGDWLYQRSPVELDEDVRAGDSEIPAREARLAAVEALADEALGEGAEYTVLRGYYLQATGGHVALVRPHGSRGEGLVVGTDMKPVAVAYQKAAPDRRICIALARTLPV
jgi:hypothetical protein